MSKIKYYLNWFKLNLFTIKPTVLAIELTNNCQAGCIMCGHELMQRKVENMNFELFKKIIDDAKSNDIKVFQLSFYGEPLLYHDLINATKYISDTIPESVIVINTNAYYLSKEKSQQLLNAGIKLFSISVDGNNKEEFEKIRPGLKWDTIYENIKNLRQIIDQSSQNAQIHIRGLHLKNYPIDESLYHQTWGQFADKIQIRNEHDLDKLEGETIINKLIPCHRIMSQMVVLANGEVTICAYDWAGSQKYGNLQSNSILDLWFRWNNIKLRLIHLLGLKRTLSYCRDCTYKVHR